MPILKSTLCHAFLLSFDIHLHQNPCSHSSRIWLTASLLFNSRPSNCVLICIPIQFSTTRILFFGSLFVLLSFLFPPSWIIPALSYYLCTLCWRYLHLIHTSRFVKRFELLFVESVKSVSRFIVLFTYRCLLSSTPFVEKTSLLHCIAFSPQLNVSWLHLRGSIFGFSIPFHLSICLFFHHYHTFWTTVAVL